MSENERIIAGINAYCQSNSLLVIFSDGRLRRLHCPFKVIVISDTYTLREGDVVDVLAVKISSELLLLYVIHRTAYPYYHFLIPNT